MNPKTVPVGQNQLSVSPVFLNFRRAPNQKIIHQNTKKVAVTYEETAGKRKSTKSKILWSFVWLVILFGLFYQMCERVYHFYTIKPVMNTQLVTRAAIPFPILVACPCDEQYRHPAVDPIFLQELYGNISYSNVYDLMDATQMDIKTLWNISRLVTTNQIFTLSDGLKLATGFEEKTELVAEITEIFTTSGTCFHVRAKADVQHDGFYTDLGIEGFRKYNATPSFFQLAYTSEDKIPLLRYLYPKLSSILLTKTLNDIVLKMEEVHLLNTRSLPCKDGMSITKCLVECIEKKIFSKVHKPCRLPYMELSTNIPDCSTSQEFQAVYNATAQVVQRFRMEECKSCNLRQCQEVIYHFESHTENEFEGIFFKVWVKIAENRFPYTQEEIIYSLMALFSDLAGSLGFFLGICALQMIEFLVKICNLVVGNKSGPRLIRQSDVIPYELYQKDGYRKKSFMYIYRP